MSTTTNVNKSAFLKAKEISLPLSFLALSRNEDDVAHLTPFGKEFQTEDEAKKAITKCCLTVCSSIEKRHGG